MKYNWLFVFLVMVFMNSCSSQKSKGLSQFPLQKEATWIYSYESYDQSPSDPTQIIKATYHVTETIVETGTISAYFVAHVKREYELIKADKGWASDLSSQLNEFWYLVNQNQVFQSNQLLDSDNIKLDELIFDYEFPLSVNKSWCLLPRNPNDPKEVSVCEFIGKREVTKLGPYETPAGSFDSCYDMVDYFNGGNFFQTFCNGIGIVSKKFDHAGTRFGFEQILIDYSVGTP